MDMSTPVAPAAHDDGIEAHPMKFTGDGGVYFGVWIVNIVLMVVTLGLYTPFARRRTIQYFYGHTLVAGSPLEFTGGLKRMFLGYLLFFGLYLAYSIASNTGQDVAAGLLVLGGLLLAPLLWASAQRFRLASTRWRGIRGHFGARTREAYAASWPLLALFGLWAAVGVAAVGLRGTRPDPLLAVAVGLGLFLANVLCLVVLDFNYSRLRVLRADIGGQVGRWKPTLGDFLRLTAAAFGVFLAMGTGVVVVLAVLGGGSVWLWGTPGNRGAAAVLVGIAIGVAALLVFYLAMGPAFAYREARKFALVWNNVGLGNVARFRCSLRPWPFVRLRVRNILLTLLTAGFFRPFAVTSEYRMKLESVTLHVKGGLDQLAGRLAQRERGAGADALADAVGFDLIG